MDNFFNVSVIVPLYNGAKFIERRLDSIIDQDLKPREIILLDDASTDNGVEIGKEILEKNNIDYKININEENVGIRNQIINGINLSECKYIWFAEQDDYCLHNFLYNIREMFVDENVNLAYCNSIPVNENLEPIETYYNKDLVLKNNNDFCIESNKFVIDNLSYINTIPNISSVVFNKNALDGVEKVLEGYTVFFDWIMYLYALRSGKVSYGNKVLNYHTRHENSVIALKGDTPEYHKDVLNVRKYIYANILSKNN